MPNLLHGLTTAMQSQLVGGGLVLMLSGAIMALLRQTPGKLIALVKHQIQVQVDVLDRDAAFAWLNQWLDAHPYTKKARSVTVSTTYQEDELKVLFAPAPGTHRIKHKGRVFWVIRNRTQPGDKSGQVTESFTIRSFGRSPAPLRSLMLDAKNFAQKADNTIAIYVSHKDYWTRASTAVARPLTSVMLPAGVTDGIAADIQEFLNSRAWYGDRGIPWRRGYLLHGPPGTGKTSLISALAGTVGFNLYVLNLGSKGLSDEGLVQMLLNVPRGAAVLLEDIDAIVNGREMASSDKEGSSLTFTGLLNAIDGVASRPGLILFMTTNHREKLDPALIRPGRIDKQIEFSAATRDQIRDFFLHFYKDTADDTQAEGFADAIVNAGSVSMADVQQRLLVHKTDPKAAIDSVLIPTSS